MTVAVYNSIDRMIRMAMFDAGLLEEGTDPTPDQQGNYVQRLLDMIQVWQLEGCKLFLIRDLVVPLVLNQTSYVITPKPFRIEDVYWRDAAGTQHREIFRCELHDWIRLSPAQPNGTITQFYEDRQSTTVTLNVWNKPGTYDVAGQLHVVVRSVGTGNVTSVADSITLNFPIEWAMALRWGLAADLCTGQPDSIVQRCERQAMYYKGVLENFDVEQGGITFQPDRSNYQPSRFK
jgi:hypothetical protein